MACGPCPLYFSDLRKGVSKVVSATDASEKAGALRIQTAFPIVVSSFLTAHVTGAFIQPMMSWLWSAYDGIGGAWRL